MTKHDIAFAFQTSPTIAASILLKRGVHPVDFGAGRARGKRWLKSAVDAVIQALHDEAQPTQRTYTKRPEKQPVSILSMPVDELYDLTTGAHIQ